MCGIVGYVGQRAVQDVLLAGLEKLEYRGYDSAGISVLSGGEFSSVRAVGNAGPFVMTGLQWLENPLAGAAPTSNGFEVTLTAARAATLDLLRMRIDPTRTVTGTVTSDGPLRLSLSGVQAMPTVYVGGVKVAVVKDGKVIAFDVPAGTTEIRVVPKR